MLRNIIILSLISFFTFNIANAQIDKPLEKFQTISTKNASEIIVTSSEEDYYNFGDNIINETSVIVKIEVASKTFPSRILKAMIEQGDFNVRYKVSNGKLLVSHLKKTLEVRYEGVSHQIDFNYEFLVPDSIAYSN